MAEASPKDLAELKAKCYTVFFNGDKIAEFYSPIYLALFVEKTKIFESGCLKELMILVRKEEG